MALCSCRVVVVISTCARVCVSLSLSRDIRVDDDAVGVRSTRIMSNGAALETAFCQDRLLRRLAVDS